MKKILWKYRYGFLLIFPLLLVIFSYREADTRFSYNLSRFFPKTDFSKEEGMIYSELSGQAGIELSDRDKKELARAIVRHGQRLAIPDGFMLGGYKPIPSLFLYTWAKTRTNFEQKKARGYGILDLPEIFVREMEKKTGSKINREYDILRYSIQYKLVLLRFKELLSESETVSVAYAKLYGNSVQVGEWNLFENNYKKIHEKVIYESKP